MDFNKQLEHTRKYAEAFWNHEMLDRPYVHITAPIKDTGYAWTPAMSFRACMSGDYDSILVPFQEMVDNTYFAGEALPNIDITLGPDQYAGFLGGTIETSGENVTTWVHPCVDSWEGFEVKIDQSEDSYYQKIKAYYEYAAKKAEGHFILNMLDFHSNLDAMSALRSAQELCFDLIDYPEEVKRVLGEINGTYRDVLNMVYEAGRMKEVGTMGWSPIYCRDKAAVLQCDFSCLLSPAQGREFVFPAIEEEASHLDHTVYHLDGKDALCHLDTILSMDCIDCVQWVPGEGQPRSMEWMDVLKKIQAAGKSLWIFDWTADEIKAYHKELQPDKVAFTLGAATPDEADSLIEYLAKNC